MRRRWFRSESDRDDLDRELQDHLDLEAEEFERAGLSPSDARDAARRAFGNVAIVKENVRATRPLHWLEPTRQDLRFAWRTLRRSPAFFLGALLTLAMGVGANGAVFSVVQAALLQPLPYTHPEQLHMLWRTFPGRADRRSGLGRPAFDRGVLTSPSVVGWRRGLAGDVGPIAALLTWQGNLEAQFDLASGDRVMRLNSAIATPNFFELLGVRAELGRVFGAVDERDGASLVVLSHAMWRRNFGGDSSVVGRAITLSGGRPRVARSYVVAGILPPEVHFTYPVETEAWVMMPWSYVERYDPRAIAFLGVVRLSPRVALAAAHHRLAGLRPGLDDLAGVPIERRPALSLESMSEWVRGEVRPSLELLGGVASLLLLVSCVTVAGAQLARVRSRTRELAVRTALGARRTRLVRQLLTEGALLCTAGAVAGTALVAAVRPLLHTLLPESVPQVGSVTATAPIVLFGAVAAVLTIALATIIPAWAGTKVDVSGGLSIGDGRSSANRTTKRWHHALIATQTAIATVLLVAATLLLTSFWQLGRVPLGFDGDEVLTVEMRLLGAPYREPASVERFQNDLLARLRSIPGLTRVGLTSAVPFRGVDFTLNIGRPGTDSSYLAKGRYVDAEYFEVLRIPLLRGRVFAPNDVRGSRPVVVVSESLARSMFGAANPIGQEILFDAPHEIVGVAADVRYVGRDRDPGPALYFSRAQSPSNLMCVVARTGPHIRAADVGPAIYRAIHETDPTVPAMRLTTVDEIVDATIANRRFYTIATVTFAVIAFVLTTVGLVVVIARVVAERRRELAIRAALGATAGRIARHASNDSVTSVVGGMLLGLGVAYVMSPLLGQFLFGVEVRSVITYAAVAMLMLSVAVIGVALPMRAFARLSVSEALKAD